MKLSKLRDMINQLQSFDDCEVKFIGKYNDELNLELIGIDQLSDSNPEILIKLKDKTT